MHTADALSTLAFVLLGLTLAHAVLALTEHYFPRSQAGLALRFIVGGGN